MGHLGSQSWDQGIATSFTKTGSAPLLSESSSGVKLTHSNRVHFAKQTCFARSEAHTSNSGLIRNITADMQYCHTTYLHPPLTVRSFANWEESLSSLCASSPAVVSRALKSKICRMDGCPWLGRPGLARSVPCAAAPMRLVGCYHAQALLPEHRQRRVGYREATRGNPQANAFTPKLHDLRRKIQHFSLSCRVC